jgi:hypothetical protein
MCDVWHLTLRPRHPPSQGAAGKKPKKTMYVPGYVLYLAWNPFRRTCDIVIFLSRFWVLLIEKRPKTKNAIQKIDKGENKLDARPRSTFFITVFFCCPYREALNQRNNKNRQLRKKKIPPYFPGDFFGKRTQICSRVFELPLPRNAQKRTKKNV